MGVRSKVACRYLHNGTCSPDKKYVRMHTVLLCLDYAEWPSKIMTKKRLINILSSTSGQVCSPKRRFFQRSDQLVC